jgi:hypothetical protein
MDSPQILDSKLKVTQFFNTQKVTCKNSNIFFNKKYKRLLIFLLGILIISIFILFFNITRLKITHKTSTHNACLDMKANKKLYKNTVFKIFIYFIER